MLVSNCCGAEFRDLETMICVCCNEHTDIIAIEPDEPSFHTIDMKEYNHTSYRNAVLISMTKKYGSKDNAIFGMQKSLESLEKQASHLRELIMKGKE